MTEAPGPMPSEDPAFPRKKIALLLGAVGLVLFLLFPWHLEPGIRWGYRFGPSTVKGMDTYRVEPPTRLGRFLFQRGVHRWTLDAWPTGTPAPTGPKGYPRAGLRGRQVPGSIYPLVEIWMDAEAEARVRGGGGK